MEEQKWEGNSQEQIEAFEKFSEIAREYIYKHGTPHSTIVIMQTGIEISDGRMATSFI